MDENCGEWVESMCVVVRRCVDFLILHTYCYSCCICSFLSYDFTTNCDTVISIHDAASSMQLVTSYFLIVSVITSPHNCNSIFIKPRYVC